MVTGVWHWRPKPIFVAGVLGALFVWREGTVLLMRNILGSEGLQIESIPVWGDWFVINSMMYTVSPEMEKILILVVILLTNLEGGYIRERGFLSYLSVLVMKQTVDGVRIVMFIFILSMIRKSDEGVVVWEAPGVGGGTVSLI